MSVSPPRPILMDNHPVAQQTYIVPTPSIDAAYKEVKRCIRHRIPGALMIGLSRFGKTYATRYICSVLKEDFPKIVAVRVGCQKRKAPAESAFFENMLDAVGHQQVLKGRNNAKRLRLTNRLTELVERSGQNLLVMFLDEAQRLEVIEYEWLRDVHDKLEDRNVRMISFLVGQQKLLNQKNAFKHQGETQIIGRFMIDELPFHGVRTASDAATCLAGYDEACYPADSDWTYTRFFLPYAYDDGLRLFDQAAELWAAFRRAHDQAGFRFEMEIPMRYFSHAVEIALREYSERDKPGFRFTPAIWDEVVRDAHYVVAVEELRLNPMLDD